MGSWRLLTAGVVALFVGVVVARTESPVTSKPTKVASSPEEAVRFIFEAQKANDTASVWAQVAEPNRSALEWGDRHAQAYYASEDALKKKFGETPFDRFDLRKFGSPMTWTQSLVVVKKRATGAGRVELTLWETNKVFKGVAEWKITAVKIGRAWKLLLPVNVRAAGAPVRKKGADGKEVEVIEMISEDAISPQMPAYVKEVMPKYLALMKKLTKEVKDGKYKTREEAKQALNKAVTAFFKKHPQPETKKLAK